MSLSKKEIEHIADLARLHLQEDEILRFQQQLSDILEHVGVLQSLDTLESGESKEVSETDSRLREDVAGKAMPREELLKNAPDVKRHQFRVPPVLD